MPRVERDCDIIEHILRYCHQIDVAHDDFGHSRERFLGSTTYQNAVALCILQIGELVKHLTAEFKQEHKEIPWHQISGMRNYVAHEYGNIDHDIVWNASTVSLRNLRGFCETYLAK